MLNWTDYHTMLNMQIDPTYFYVLDKKKLGKMLKVWKKVSMPSVISGRIFITFLQLKYTMRSVLTWSLYSKAKSWRHIKACNSVECVGNGKNRIFCKHWCRDEFGFSSHISSYQYIYFNALKFYVSTSILACFIAPNLALQYGGWHTQKAIQRFNVLLSGLIRHTPIRHEARIRIRIRIYANIRGVSMGGVGPETLDVLRNAW